MPITSEGYELKRFVDIVSEINQEQITNLAADLNTSPDTVLGVLTNIFANAISSQEELNQAVSDNFNIDKAEGKYLDDLVALIGVTRLDKSKTSGTLEVTGEEGASIPLTATFSDTNNTLVPTSSAIVTQDACVKALYSVPSIVVGASYTIRINTQTYSHTAQSGDTSQSIIEALVTSSETNPLVTISYDSINDLMVVESQQKLSTVIIFVNSKFVVGDITSLASVEYTEFGDTQIEAGTVTAFTGTTGVTAVTNPFDLNIGRFDETDEELRGRAGSSTRISGSTTLPAIKAALLQVEGVTSVEIVENSSNATDSEGRPSHSYESIITGGSTTAIAQALFDSKPAGIQTYGDLLGVVTYESLPYSVYFSRPSPVYVWVKVAYTVYDEEVFPTNGEELIKESITTYGDLLGTGVDIIPKRIYTPVYSNVQGVNDLIVTVAISNDPLSQPIASEYTSDLIPVAEKNFANFNVDRIEIL